MKPANLIGERFGSLTVTQRTVNAPGNQAQWECRCDCGRTTVTRTSYLRNGHTASCGCARKRVGHERGLSNRTHGESHSVEYRTWSRIQSRCYDPNFPSYRYYGGRGIAVCARWRNSFKDFLQNMGRKPTPAHSIDRYPDNDGNYEPGNCRWATPKQQANNRRKPMVETVKRHE